MRTTLFASLFLWLPLVGSAIAQTPGTFIPDMGEETADGSTPAVKAPPAPVAPEFNPWKLSFFAEYQGPTLGNLNFSQTQTPNTASSYSELDYALKVGYAISKYVTLGIQERAYYPFDPTANFTILDQRAYVQWNHMIETSDIDLTGKLTGEFPTTSVSRAAGKIIAFKIDANVDLKTSLRGWSFSFDVMLKNTFFNDPVSNGGSNDIALAIYPYITLDMITDVQLLFEASFDAVHNYNDNFYNYQSGDFDYFDVGPLFTIGPHINTNVALRFFTDQISFNSAAIYANIGVAL